MTCVRWDVAIGSFAIPEMYFCDDKLFDVHGRQMTALEISTGEEYSSGSQLCDVCVLAILHFCPNLRHLRLQTATLKCQVASLEMFVDDRPSVLRLATALADSCRAIVHTLTSKLTIVDSELKGAFSMKTIAAYISILQANRTLRALEMAVEDSICIAETMVRPHYGEMLASSNQASDAGISERCAA